MPCCPISRRLAKKPEAFRYRLILTAALALAGGLLHSPTAALAIGTIAHRTLPERIGAGLRPAEELTAASAVLGFQAAPSCRTNSNHRAPHCIASEARSSLREARAASPAETDSDRIDPHRSEGRSGHALESEPAGGRPLSFESRRPSETAALTSTPASPDSPRRSAHLMQACCGVWQHLGSPPALRAPPLSA